MIINFSELPIPFHRLAPGAVLVSPDDTRYLKSVTKDWDRIWIRTYDRTAGSWISESQMKTTVGDGEGWKVLP